MSNNHASSGTLKIFGAVSLLLGIVYGIVDCIALVPGAAVYGIARKEV